VIYRFILAAVVFVIVGAIFDYFVEGIFVPRNTIKMIFTGVLVELVLMAGLSKHKRQLTTQEADEVREDLVKIGYISSSADSPDQNVYKEYYYRRHHYLWWDEAFLDARHHYIELRYSSRLRRLLVDFIEALHFKA